MHTTEQPLKVIITGATGMVGEGVVHECILSDAVSEVLILGRRPSGISHPKVREIVHADLMDISPIAAQLAGFDACFFCLGISSIGMNEADYTRTTHTLTLSIAKVLLQQNPAMQFCYISGASTDSTEKGRSMWARVKGRTENDLMKLPFKAVYNFRPPFMYPIKGMKNTPRAYRYINWMYRPGRALFPKYFITLSEMGRSMINAVRYGAPKQVLEPLDIVALAAKDDR